MKARTFESPGLFSTFSPHPAGEAIRCQGRGQAVQARKARLASGGGQGLQAKGGDEAGAAVLFETMQFFASCAVLLC